MDKKLMWKRILGKRMECGVCHRMVWDFEDFRGKAVVYVDPRPQEEYWKEDRGYYTSHPRKVYKNCIVCQDCLKEVKDWIKE
jgi:hypothetical protein